MLYAEINDRELSSWLSEYCDSKGLFLNHVIAPSYGIKCPVCSNKMVTHQKTITVYDLGEPGAPNTLIYERCQASHCTKIKVYPDIITNSEGITSLPGRSELK